MCFSPVTIKNPNKVMAAAKRFITVPCGKCHDCLSKRRREWSFRLEQELKVSTSALFLTLTYNDENIPLTREGECTLKKVDVQLFFKRLRANLTRGYSSITTDGKVSKIASNSSQIRYYAVGEYGSNTERPHYHIILFNLPPDYEVITKSWTLGNVFYGDVETASISYVAKYVMKTKDDFQTREPPFALMSRKTGLGTCYLEKNKSFHKKNQLFKVRSVGLGEMQIPRFYKEKIFNKSEILVNSMENERNYQIAIDNLNQRIARTHQNVFEYIDRSNKAKADRARRTQKSREIL